MDERHAVTRFAVVTHSQLIYFKSHRKEQYVAFTRQLISSSGGRWLKQLVRLVKGDFRADEGRKDEWTNNCQQLAGLLASRLHPWLTMQQMKIDKNALTYAH